MSTINAVQVPLCHKDDDTIGGNCRGWMFPNLNLYLLIQMQKLEVEQQFDAERRYRQEVEQHYKNEKQESMRLQQRNISLQQETVGLREVVAALQNEIRIMQVELPFYMVPSLRCFSCIKTHKAFHFHFYSCLICYRRFLSFRAC